MITMTGVPVFWSVVIGIISFFLFLRSRLSSKAAVDDDYGEISVGLLTNYRHIEKNIIQELPETDALWRVGITVKSASVTEETRLRLMEFRSNAEINSDYIVALLLKAMIEPSALIEETGDEKSASVRPCTVLISIGDYISQKTFDQVLDVMEEYGVKLVTKTNADLDNVLNKRRTELFKQQQESQKKLAEAAKGTPVDFASPPSRGCFVCHNEISGKASQCSACKAIIYCSANCAKEDWGLHKQACSLFKTNMDHIVSMSLHDFPFTYYPENKPLGNYNTVNMLVRHGVHNIGVFRRLCICYQEVPMGELLSETMGIVKDSKITDPKDIFNTTGLDSAWFPLSAPLNNSRKIKNWKSLFETKGISFDDIAPFVLDHAMTVWHFLNMHILDSVDANIKDGRKVITLHYLGAEMECDFLPTFEILLGLIPAKTDLVIHMIGPSVSKTLSIENRHFNFHSKENDSNLDITLSHSLYTEEYYSGSKLCSDFPSLKLGTGEPTAIIILNGLLLGYESWISSVRLIISKKAPVFCTEGMEQNAEAVARNLPNLQHNLTKPIEANPFRQPIFQFKKDANLPAWSNGFVFGF